jgi:hypothetical protein
MKPRSSSANAAYKLQKHNRGATEITEIPDRGHALTIDSGWREVADTALAFVTRFTRIRPAATATAGWRRAALAEPGALAGNSHSEEGEI